MSSVQRAYALIILAALAGTFGTCAQIVHWTPQVTFGVLSGLCATVLAGLTKSPRDAAISDATDDAESASPHPPVTAPSA